MREFIEMSHFTVTKCFNSRSKENHNSDRLCFWVVRCGCGLHSKWWMFWKDLALLNFIRPNSVHITTPLSQVICLNLVDTTHLIKFIHTDHYCSMYRSITFYEQAELESWEINEWFHLHISTVPLASWLANTPSALAKLLVDSQRYQHLHCP